MATLTIAQALQDARTAGFTGDALAIVVAVAMAESGLNPTARLINTDQWRSRDRGILQINDHWHPEVSDACADNPVCAFQQGYRISKQGTDFSPWSTYTSGAYLALLPAVRRALGPTPPPLVTLARPFAGPHTVTQGFGVTGVTSEPPGWVWPDPWPPGTVSYYHQGGQRYDHVHSGIDYAIDDNTPLVACADGTVAEATLDTTGYGLCLRIDHGQVITLYAHLTDIVVKPGQHVQAGQLVAHSGGDPAHEPNSGNSSGAHLHFSTIDTSLQPARYRDPAQYLLAARVPSGPPTHVGDPYHLLARPSQLHTQHDADPHRVFRNPSTQSRRITVLVPGAAVQIVAWTSAGEPVYDHEARRVNAVWYEVQLISSADTGWMPSARLEGTVPGAPG